MQLLGADLGGTNFRVGRVHDGLVKSVSSVAINAAGTADEVFGQLCALIDKELTPDVQGMGIGVPSILDPVTGVVYDVQNIPAWKEIHLKEKLRKRYGLPVFINNDANCFAAGEKAFGKAKPYDFAVGLIMGTGFGAGIIANGRLMSGANCGAGEFGMLPYRDGILENYCCGQFFKRKNTSGLVAFEAASRGEAAALKLFEEFGQHVGEGIKAVLYTTDPQAIVLGGSVSKSFRFFESGMRKSLSAFAYKRSAEHLRIEVSELQHVAVLGAAALYIDSLGR